MLRYTKGTWYTHKSLHDTLNANRYWVSFKYNKEDIKD